MEAIPSALQWDLASVTGVHQLSFTDLVADPVAIVYRRIFAIRDFVLISNIKRINQNDLMELTIPSRIDDHVEDSSTVNQQSEYRLYRKKKKIRRRIVMTAPLVPAAPNTKSTMICAFAVPNSDKKGTWSIFAVIKRPTTRVVIHMANIDPTTGMFLLLKIQILFKLDQHGVEHIFVSQTCRLKKNIWQTKVESPMNMSWTQISRVDRARAGW